MCCEYLSARVPYPPYRFTVLHLNELYTVHTSIYSHCYQPSRVCCDSSFSTYSFDLIHWWACTLLSIVGRFCGFLLVNFNRISFVGDFFPLFGSSVINQFSAWPLEHILLCQWEKRKNFKCNSRSDRKMCLWKNAWCPFRVFGLHQIQVHILHQTWKTCNIKTRYTQSQRNYSI